MKPIDTKFDGRRKPRGALTRSERRNPELVRAFRHARRVARVPVSGLSGPEAAARIQRHLSLGALVASKV